MEVTSELYALTKDGQEASINTFLTGKYEAQIEQVEAQVFMFIQSPDESLSDDLQILLGRLSEMDFDVGKLVLQVIAAVAVSGYSEITALVARFRKSLEGFDDSEQIKLMGELICSMSLKGFLQAHRGNSVEGSSKPCVVFKPKLSESLKDSLVCWESRPFHLEPVKVNHKMNRHSMCGSSYNQNELCEPDYASLQRSNDTPVRLTPNLNAIEEWFELNPSEKQQKNMKNFFAWEASVNHMSDMAETAGTFYYSHRFQPTGREQCDSTVLSYQGNKQVKWRIHCAEPYDVTTEGLYAIKAYIGELSGVAKNATRQYYVNWVDSQLAEGIDTLKEACYDPRYLDSVLELEKVLNGEPTTLFVPQDAPASGSTLVSLLMGCKASLRTCGMFGKEVRREPYTQLAEAVAHILGDEATRDFSKSLIVPMVFGCRGGMKPFKPELRAACNDYFKEQFPALTKYLDLCSKLCPTGEEGVYVENWRGFTSYIPFTVKRQEKFKLELLNSVMTFKWKESGEANKGNTFLAPAMAHILDATLIAETKARIGYDVDAVNDALSFLQFQDCEEGELLRPIHMREALAVVDGVEDYSPAEYFEIRRILTMCLDYAPEALLAEYDDILGTANNAKQIRLVYTDIMAAILDCNVLQEMLISATGKMVKDPRTTKFLGADLKATSHYCLA